MTLLAYFIWPFIDSYLACGMSFFALQKQPAQSEENAPGNMENAPGRCFGRTIIRTFLRSWSASCWLRSLFFCSAFHTSRPRYGS